MNTGASKSAKSEGTNSTDTNSINSWKAQQKTLMNHKT